ncbi:Fic family protein [Halomonas caseinilytica]|uniref:Protein adenylyltransferase n=1 Tax=Halomonas caseinilytica TaxID=438744 RepID=A0A1M6Z6H7_9GAMM|nr:Fic/DOC family N-terminal domain-containing protein [Halomonas caseinilytica]SHL26035.1 Fic family protein [Halomonas caseinilytica]
MDDSDFQRGATGRLVEVSLPRSKYAFVPDPMPRDWEMPTRLWPLLAEAKEAIARLDGMGRYMPNPELLLRPLQNREALRSSSMEGTYATPEELLLYDASPVEPSSDKDRANEWREVWNYGRALLAGKAILDAGYPLSLALLRTMHEELLSGVRGQDKSPGEFRKGLVQIGHDARFVPPPDISLSDCLQDFDDSLKKKTSYDCLIKAFMMHYQFETIHPFKDGNGRVGRLLLSLQMYKELDLANPWVYMSAFFEKYKDEYIEYLYNVSTKGDWETWLAFCLRGVKEQANDSLSRVDLLVGLKEEYQEKIHSQSQASARLVQISSDLFENPVVTIPAIARRYDVSFPTAKSDVNRLVKLEILKKHPESQKPQIFFADGIMRAAYGEE